MAQVRDGENLQLTFRRCVSEDTLCSWNELLNVIKNVPFNNMADKTIWSLESKGLYSVKSMYKMINWGAWSLSGGIIFGKLKFPLISMCFYG